MTLADEIADYVCSTDWVTHGELLNRLGRDRLAGDFVVEHPESNTLWFAGCSEELVEALRVLREERPRRVALVGIDPLCHFCDGTPLVPGMPFMKSQPPKGGFKKQRYASVGFRPASEVSA